MNIFYLTHNGQNLVAKNNLELGIQKYLESIDRTLIDKANIDEFLLKISNDINDISLKNPRCKKPNISFYNYNEDFRLQGVDSVSFMIFHSNKVY